MKLNFVIPKGSLQEATLNLLRQAGYEVKGSERSYRPWINDPEINLKVLRPQEIPNLVESGAHDLGITGADWVEETSADVVTLSSLAYGKVRIVLAVPNYWTEINSLSDLIRFFSNAGKPIRIATEYINLSLRRIMANSEYRTRFGSLTPEVITPWYRYGENPNVKILLSFGATEAKPPEDAEAIIDNTETGTTILSNNLKIIEEICESQAVLISNRDALNHPWKREKIKDVMTLLEGAVDARDRLHIFMNVKEENLQAILKILPALKRPTISPLAGEEGWYAINTVIHKDEFLRIVPHLRQLAQGLVVYEPRQVLALEKIQNKL
ncbi:MAG: ATP phosphoribosyltransferase [Candidatus Jordarchaeales archaeon]|nr:ATP phosphoribosyltransferase [Candidatus Jordarchaeia archaeon]